MWQNENVTKFQAAQLSAPKQRPMSNKTVEIIDDQWKWNIMTQ